MKFEIKFDEEIYKDQMEIYFNSIWETNLKRNKNQLLWSVPIIALGILLANINPILGIVFIAIGIHYLIIYFNYKSHYKTSKNVFNQQVNEEIQGYVNCGKPTIWEFSEDHLKITDYRFNSEMKWVCFKMQREINGILFLDLKVGNNLSYIIGENEIGTENYKKTLEFVKSKVKAST